MPKLVGLVALTDLLRARVTNLEAETKRRRILPIRLFLPGRFEVEKEDGSLSLKL